MTENKQNALESLTKLVTEISDALRVPHLEPLTLKRYQRLLGRATDALHEISFLREHVGDKSIVENYVEESERTLADPRDVLLVLDEDKVNVLHACLGLSTEVGELVDAFKKWVYYGNDYDKVNVEEEVGDLFWYLAIIARVCGIDLEECLVKNIRKLRHRYPKKFTQESATNRDLEGEREKLNDRRRKANRKS